MKSSAEVGRMNAELECYRQHYTRDEVLKLIADAWIWGCALDPDDCADGDRMRAESEADHLLRAFDRKRSAKP